jgi:hypothetical protein
MSFGRGSLAAVKLDSRLDLVRVGGPVREYSVNLRPGHDSLETEVRWVLGRSQLTEPHRDFPYVGTADQTGTSARWAVSERDHRVLVAACALLGVAT